MIATWALPTRSVTSRREDSGLRRLPGVILCCTVAALAYVLAWIEHRITGAAWLEPLVLAILIGMLIRSVRSIPSMFKPGIETSAKTMLEVAVVLLGASVSSQMIAAVRPAFLAGIGGVVVTAIVASFLICRTLRLPPRMALLIACGNSICGNSAIAAVAPIIEADGGEVAASIAFTAVLGVAVVLALPLIGMSLGLTTTRYGTLAGLTVYAVPQVIAAAAPFGSSAIQMGTLVKLVRVMMLGPVCVTLSLIGSRITGSEPGMLVRGRPPLHRLIPWFIIGFLMLVLARSLGAIPPAAIAVSASVATPLTVVAMAALGLGVDVRTVARAGTRVSLAVILSLLALGAISLLMIGVLPVA